MILKVQYLTICVIVSSIYASYYSRLLAGNQLIVDGRWGGGDEKVPCGHFLCYSNGQIKSQLKAFMAS